MKKAALRKALAAAAGAVRRGQWMGAVEAGDFRDKWRAKDDLGLIASAEDAPPRCQRIRGDQPHDQPDDGGDREDGRR